MNFNAANVKGLLGDFAFETLFIDELGWDRRQADLEVVVGGETFALKAVAQKRGMVAWRCDAPSGRPIPDRATRKKIETRVARTTLEHFIIHTDDRRAAQVWSWSHREAGKPVSVNDHIWDSSTSNRSLVEKLERLFVSLDEEETLTLPGVLGKARAAFDVEKVTRRFYDRFKAEHKAFLDVIGGIPDSADREWYASLMLNRMMFVYFMQRKGFLDGKPDYLADKLAECRARFGRDRFYSFYRTFLLRLFHDGLGRRGTARTWSASSAASPI